jgi:hypothetical protein
MSEEKKFYVYVHRKSTDGSVFYVGKGKGRRAWNKSQRNRYWHSTVNKHGYTVSIVFRFESEMCAFSFERALIKLYGRFNLCNLTDGGDGVSGMVHSDISKSKMSGPRPNAKIYLRGKSMSLEMKEKLALAKLGKKQSIEHAAKSAMAKIGKKQPISAVEKVASLKRVSIYNSTGEIFESVTLAAKKLSDRTGKNVSQGTISMALCGKRKTAYGFSWGYVT